MFRDIAITISGCIDLSLIVSVTIIPTLTTLIIRLKPGEEYRPGIHIQDDEELVKAGSEYAQTIFHPVGTCKMGNDEKAVVNDRLLVHGLEGLRIIDASIMPHITSGIKNAPTIMIAEKAADMIIADQKN